MCCERFRSYGPPVGSVSDDEINLPLFIDKAAQVMKAVPDTLMETQQATVTKIQQKLALAQEKAKSNLQVTKPELDGLLAELIENLRNLDALLNPNASKDQRRRSISSCKVDILGGSTHIQPVPVSDGCLYFDPVELSVS